MARRIWRLCSLQQHGVAATWPCFTSLPGQLQPVSAVSVACWAQVRHAKSILPLLPLLQQLGVEEGDAYRQRRTEKRVGRNRDQIRHGGELSGISFTLSKQKFLSCVFCVLRSLNLLASLSSSSDGAGRRRNGTAGNTSNAEPPQQLPPASEGKAFNRVFCNLLPNLTLLETECLVQPCAPYNFHDMTTFGMRQLHRIHDPVTLHVCAHAGLQSLPAPDPNSPLRTRQPATPPSLALR